MSGENPEEDFGAVEGVEGEEVEDCQDDVDLGEEGEDGENGGAGIDEIFEGNEEDGGKNQI